jgi:hypothetical protein
LNDQSLTPGDNPRIGPTHFEDWLTLSHTAGSSDALPLCAAANPGIALWLQSTRFRPRPAELGSLGSLEAATGRFKNELNTDTQAGEHVDERVSTEQIYPAPKQVAHPRLCYAENFGRLGLLEASGRDQLLDLDHQVGSDEQVLGLVGRKA